MPRDTVFVRDGRSFDAADDAFAQTVRPTPTTIAGAVGAAFGGANPLTVRGPVLARRNGEGWEPYFTVPTDLVVTAARGKRVYRMRPEPGGTTDLGNGTGGLPRMLAPPEHAEPVQPVTEEEPGVLLPGRVLADYLAGRLVGGNGVPLTRLQLEVPLRSEQRIGLARDGRRAREGYLYQAVHLRPEDGWAFLAEYTVDDKWPAEGRNHVPFGGRGRVAEVGRAEAAWPDATAAIGKQVLVYLATPAVWPGGWRMPVPQGAELIAAATGEPVPVATVTPGPDWKKSRVLRWAVPAGSVYLLEFEDAAAGAQWARTWNGVALDRGVSSTEADLLRTAGFGVVLTGVWT
jgi:CRISPR-associated protein Cmr3